MTVEKPKPKQLLRPITRGANSEMNQSQFLAMTCNPFEAREKPRVHGTIGFGFASHWLKFKPITKRSNRNHVIIFDSHLKTALQKLYLPDRAQCSPFLSAQQVKEKNWYRAFAGMIPCCVCWVRYMEEKFASI